MNSDLALIHRRLDQLEATTRLADRWLTATAIFLTLFGFLGLFIGVGWMRELHENVQRSRELLLESRGMVAEIRTNRAKSKSVLADIEQQKEDAERDEDSEGLFEQLSSVSALSALGTPTIGEGILQESESASKEVRLDSSKVYTIVGFCDLSCDDLDLEVFDPDNRSIAQDYLGDDVPIVTVVPLTTGSYRVRVSMYSCGHNEGCAWEYNIYEEN